MEARVGKTYLTDIPHGKGNLTFQYPAFKGTYGSVAEAIDKAGLKRPGSSETASLVYDAFQNPEGEYESEIRGILKNNWLWEFTGNLYLPKSEEEVNKGVIIVANPQIVSGKLAMSKDSLTERLRENDPLVKFVPFGYKTGEQTTLELLKNPYIIARYGEEGADKIAQIASNYKKNPKLWSFDSVNEEIARMSALGGGWNFDAWLDVIGNDLYDYYVGRAFGVSNSEQPTN